MHLCSTRVPPNDPIDEHLLSRTRAVGQYHAYNVSVDGELFCYSQCKPKNLLLLLFFQWLCLFIVALISLGLISATLSPVWSLFLPELVHWLITQTVAGYRAQGFSTIFHISLQLYPKERERSLRCMGRERELALTPFTTCPKTSTSPSPPPPPLFAIKSSLFLTWLQAIGTS